MADRALVGVEPCGCFTAALSLRHGATEKEIGEFYLSMSKSRRAVREVDVEEARRGLIFEKYDCPHGAAATEADCPACGAPAGYPPAGPCENHGTPKARLASDEGEQ